MNIKKILLFCCVVIGVIFLSQKVNACSVVPSVIDSFSPTEIVPNETEVTINGKNFNDDMQDSKVNFGPSMPGTIISWSDTKIVARAPYSVYKEINVEICCGWQCQSSNHLTFSIKPKITNLNPNIVASGQVLTISGNDFGSVQGSVYIGGQQAKITQWYSTSATVIVPNITSGNTSIEVRTSNGSTSQQSSIEIISSCTYDNWSCTDWGPCSVYGKQTKICSKISNCEGGVQLPATTQSCTYIPTCSQDTWECGNWTTCSSDGSQTRVCNKTNDCATADTPSPATTQNCIPPVPTCTADTWTCDAWGACSLSGIQSRNCSKTFDCPSVQTAPPITDQFCEAPNRPQQTAPSESDEITNQDTIIKATVKLLCPVDEQKASQGSGTVIDSAGTILTNKHVIAGTLGCLVGFIDNFSDEPYFGDRQIADIVKVSSNQDIAVLKIRNPKNKALPYVNTTNGNVNFALGTKITTYGYPAKFGTKVTYTSGDFSGNDGGYLKTTAILEYGNSGGGAYLKNGTYIGIPSAVVKGELNAMGYILSINTIRAWLNNSAVASGNTNNNYSRVSVLENIDLKKLSSLKLFIPNVDKNSNLVTPTTNQNTQKNTDQQQMAPQQESVVIESNNLNKDNNTSSIQNVSSTPEQHPKTSLIKRFFLWLSNLFNKLATR